MQGALKITTNDGSEENATCITHLKIKKSLQANKTGWACVSSMLQATWPGFPTVKLCSFVGMFTLLDSWWNARKNIYTHILSSFIEPCIQSQKEKSSFSTYSRVSKKKTNHGNMDTRDLGRGSKISGRKYGSQIQGNKVLTLPTISGNY